MTKTKAVRMPTILELHQTGKLQRFEARTDAGKKILYSRSEREARARLAVHGLTVKSLKQVKGGAL